MGIAIVAEGGVPVGVLYEDTSRPSFDAQLADIRANNSQRPTDAQLAVFDL